MEGLFGYLHKKIFSKSAYYPSICGFWKSQQQQTAVFGIKIFIYTRIIQKTLICYL